MSFGQSSPKPTGTPQLPKSDRDALISLVMSLLPGKTLTSLPEDFVKVDDLSRFPTEVVNSVRASLDSIIQSKDASVDWRVVESLAMNSLNAGSSGNTQIPKQQRDLILSLIIELLPNKTIVGIPADFSVVSNPASKFPHSVVDQVKMAVKSYAQLPGSTIGYDVLLPLITSDLRATGPDISKEDHFAFISLVLSFLPGKTLVNLPSDFVPVENPASRFSAQFVEKIRQVVAPFAESSNDTIDSPALNEALSKLLYAYFSGVPMESENKSIDFFPAFARALHMLEDSPSLPVYPWLEVLADGLEFIGLILRTDGCMLILFL